MKHKAPEHRSRGVVLLVVMACLAIAMTLIVGWTRIALLENHQARAAEDRLQTEWLADSAMRRAAAQLVENSEYPGETWQVTAADVGRRTTTNEADVKQADVKQAEGGALPLGEVLIAVERVADRPGARQVSVKANFPVAKAAGTQPGFTTHRISRQTIFDLAEPTAK